MQNYYEELQKYRQKEERLKEKLTNRQEELKKHEQIQKDLLNEENKINKIKIELNNYKIKIAQLDQNKQIFKYSILPSDILILVSFAILLIPPITNLLANIISKNYIALFAFCFTMSIVARIISINLQARKEIKRVKRELYSIYGNDDIEYLRHHNNQRYLKNIDNQRMINNHIKNIQKKINHIENEINLNQTKIEELYQVTDIILKTVCTNDEISERIETIIPKRLQLLKKGEK